jgi:hypothetical protein
MTVSVIFLWSTHDYITIDPQSDVRIIPRLDFIYQDGTCALVVQCFMEWPPGMDKP